MTKEQSIAQILERIAHEAPINGNHIAQARVLLAAKMYSDQPAKPDCRTCHYYAGLEGCFNGLGCTNGDKYQPAPKVVLWRTE